MWKNKIKNYYDQTLLLYQYFWYGNSESLALHYGFWDKDTKNLSEALINTNKFLANLASVESADLVLDAGCGVGGSSIWLAKNFGRKVIGITLSKRQVDMANKLALKADVSDLVSFRVMDYLHTDFPDSSFDVVWAIESVCHCENKKDFINEAYRLLKKGGRLVVSDGFLSRDPRNKNEKMIIETFCEGLALPNLIKPIKFKNYLQEAGLNNIKYFDKTYEVMASSWRLYWLTTFGYPIAKILERLGLVSDLVTKNGLAGIVQYEALRISLGEYGVFYAEK